MKAFAASLAIFFASQVLGGEPVIEKWTTNDGVAADAVFHSLDRENDFVDLLFLKRVPLSRLDADSKSLAIRRSEEREAPAEPIVVTSKRLPLATTTLVEWVSADQKAKDEFASDVIVMLLSTGLSTAELRNELSGIKSIETLGKSFSESMTKSIDALDKLEPNSDAANSQEPAIVFAIAVSNALKWTNRDHNGGLISKNIAVSGLTVSNKNGTTKILGELRSLRPKRAEMLTLNIGFYDQNQKLVGLATHLAIDVEPSSVTPFEIQIHNADFDAVNAQPRLSVINLIEAD